MVQILFDKDSNSIRLQELAKVVVVGSKDESRDHNHRKKEVGPKNFWIHSKQRKKTFINIKQWKAIPLSKRNEINIKLSNFLKAKNIFTEWSCAQKWSLEWLKNLSSMSLKTSSPTSSLQFLKLLQNRKNKWNSRRYQKNRRLHNFYIQYIASHIFSLIWAYFLWI